MHIIFTLINLYLIACLMQIIRFLFFFGKAETELSSDSDGANHLSKNAKLKINPKFFNKGLNVKPCIY